MNFLKKIISKFKEAPLSFLSFLFVAIICKIRSKYYSKFIDEGGGKIIITKPFIKFKLIKHDTAQLYVKGNFRIIPHVGGDDIIYIKLNQNSNLIIKGDFVIGQGVRVVVSDNATLSFGGKDKESDSGITSDSLIMVNKSVKIGADFICAWDVFITDSDWHQIKGQNHQSDVIIGNHVWIANNNNILKGSVIGNNSIIASSSKISMKSFPDNVLIGGIPPRVLKEDIEWSRDID